MLAADNWCVRVEDRVYGPYTSQQLRKFAHQGRFAPWSLIAPAGSRTWREASTETAFASFFGSHVQRTGAPAERAFGKRNTAREPASPAQDEASTAVNGRRLPALPDEDHTPARQVDDTDPQTANFIIVFDIVSAAASRVETAVLSLGPAFRLAENIWTLTCELSAVGVRNAITPYLLPRESILVVDATRGRTSWQNFTPELHAKLAAAWASTRV